MSSRAADPGGRVPWRAFSLGVVLFWSLLASMEFLAHDAVSYLAAGERLNAGHALYALVSGDRPLEMSPPFWTVPLLSPPLIAVVFRPLAALPFEVGMWAWMVVSMAAISWVAWYLGTSARRFLFIAALGIGFGMETISGNMASFLIVGYLVVWWYRDRPWVGALVGVMMVAKLYPGLMIGFLVARREPRQLGSLALGALGATALAVLGAGLGAHIDYLDVIGASAPQPSSLAYLTHVPWLSFALLPATAALAAVLPERWSYRVCILGIVFAGPTLAWASLPALACLLAPATAAPRRSAQPAET